MREPLSGGDMLPSPRVLLVGNVPLRDDEGGAGRVLGRLLQGLPARRVLALLPSETLAARPPLGAWSDAALGYHVPSPVRALSRSWRRMMRAHASLALHSGMVAIRRFHPEVLLAAPQSALDVHLALQAARELAVPHAVYLDDGRLLCPDLDLDAAHVTGELRALLATAALRVLGSSSLARECVARLGPLAGTALITPRPVTPGPGPRRGRADPHRLVISHVGTVEPCHVDALATLAHAAALVRRMGLDVCLRVHTDATSWQRSGLGALSSGVEHAPAPHDVGTVCAQSDWVVMPGSFLADWSSLHRCRMPELLTTVLACGKPVLVVGQRGSACAAWVEEHGAGVVLETPAPARVAEQLRAVLSDEQAHRERADAAWRLAVEQCALELLQRKLADALREIPLTKPARIPGEVRDGGARDAA
ncbi:MAG: hypothetical protein AB2A00_00065 [Myxococcota bacterium]